MSFRPSLLSRWLAQAELMRAAPAYRQTLFILQRQPSLSSQVSQTMRRSLTTATNYTSRVMPRSRPGLRSVQLPRQRTNRRFNSGSSSNASEPSKEGGSVSQRLRKLSREYGWAALGVYLTLSALDFPICFAAVRLLGPERIGHYEHVVVQSVKNTFPSIWPETKTEGEEDGSLVQTEASKYEEASIWTQLALAYAIHKSVFIFVRVPLTAAVTPKVVQVLRSWGYNIGKRRPKTP
ncbi:uncharacterized protein N7484_008726 [Penicillium longicatenatum]|uniref:uncharacterized protein n=1 Tax=Penicillium longicatenatum TaxID=1561947 RepID=UPI00254895D8|nr:uncharacterized protein N7484_008726 [Penicillium longicatenatum]KAJ5635413.1 hypothetical protein N7484_008726 [Penicillium longicatenatum]